MEIKTGININRNASPTNNRDSAAPVKSNIMPTYAKSLNLFDTGNKISNPANNFQTPSIFKKYEGFQCQ